MAKYTAVLRFVLLSLLVSTSYMNCAKLVTNDFAQNSNNVDTGGDGDGLTDSGGDDDDVGVGKAEEYATADSSGNIAASQDLMFRFKIPGAQTGAVYQATSLPSWLNVSSSAGELYGTPPDIATYSSINIITTVNGQTTTQGPFTITVSGDPLKQHQWHLKNTGQASFAGAGGLSGEDMHLTQTIKKRILGQNVRIAISDSGIYDAHRGLSPNMIAGASRNYMNDYGTTGTWLGSPSPDTSEPENAHGTAVAGLAAERGWLGFGARGVAPLAKLAGFLFIQAQDHLTSIGYSNAGFLDQFTGDFDIFNYSWGDYQCSFLEYDADYFTKLKSGVTNLRGGKGAIYLKAAGNEYWGYATDCDSNADPDAYYLGNTNFSEEAVSPYITLIAAVNAKGRSSSYSSPGSGIWVSAAGGEYGYSSTTSSDASILQPALVTTDFVGCSSGMKSGAHNDFDSGLAPNTSCEHTAAMNGTSGATPVASGAVALMLSANPNLTWRDVKHILASTADQVHSTAGATVHPTTGYDLTGYTYQDGWVTNAAGYKFHNWYGFGRINVDAAVAMAQNYTANLGTFKETNTGTTWKYDSGTLNLAVPGGVAGGVARAQAVTENYTIEAVQVQVSATSCIGNLGIELTSPSGTKSIVMNINSFIPDSSMDSHMFLTNAFYGEKSAGNWTMRLIGGASGCDTTWKSWQLNVLGH